MCVEVGIGEVDRLPALVGDSDRGDQQVAIALRQRVEDSFPRRVDELHLDARLGGQRTHQVDREADDLALLVLRFERRVGSINADHIDLRRAACAVGDLGFLRLGWFGLLSAGAEQDSGKDGQGRQ